MSNFSVASASTGDGSAGGSEIMLFGVRLFVDSMRKSVSLNDLSQYVHPNDPLLISAASGNKDVAASAAAGYTSADEAPPASTGRRRAASSAASRERKRGVPWTEEEHKLFLLGLQKVGKGDWRGISRNFVKTRTPTQVASHAQKYFLRRSNLSRRRRRSSLFDITTESVSAAAATSSNAQKVVHNNATGSHSPPLGASPQATSLKSVLLGDKLPTAPYGQIKPENFSFPIEYKDWWATDEKNKPDSRSTTVDFDLSKKRSVINPSLSPLSLSLFVPATVTVVGSE